MLSQRWRTNTMTRTTTKTVTVTALGMTVVLVLGTLALAQPGPHGLDLSDEQRDQIRTIHDKQRTECRALVDKLRPAREALQSVAIVEPLDEVQLQARAEELALVQTEIAVLQARTHAAIFHVLTPEQQEKAKSHQAERQEHHGYGEHACHGDGHVHGAHLH
ncbi:MAG: periplasmic heavy metal sensor [Luteitalea sp.]|nr:periplasmic heavy metal sensor [Luteitalea sp.]